LERCGKSKAEFQGNSNPVVGRLEFVPLGGFGVGNPIRYAIGRLPLHVEPELFVSEAQRKMGMRSLDIDYVHAVEAGRLPSHHGDPFDRMLIAQARTERMVLLTADRIFESYEVEKEYCGL